MNNEYNEIIDKMLDMKPAPIPYFVLLKEFKKISPDSTEYQNAYEKVCEHPFVKEIVENQNDKGFWPSYHGDTEGKIRRLLWFGLDKNHTCLKRAAEYSLRLLCGEEPHDRFEKQDNVRWWPELFMPLVIATTLSWIDNNNTHITPYRKCWADLIEIAFADGKYDQKANATAQNEHFGFRTKCIMPPNNFYIPLLLAPHDGGNCLTNETDQALTEYLLNESLGIWYVYNSNPGGLVSLNAENRDSRDFCHWIRALSIISQYKGWAKHEKKYTDWIMGKRNQDGLWAFPKKHYWFGLSDSWRGNNRTIDSTIFVLRMLMKKQAL